MPCLFLSVFSSLESHFNVPCLFLSVFSSLESRDNPFLPGGDLSKEAEELLSKATIVRDKFYLDQEQRRNTAAQAQAQGQGHAQAQTQAQAQGQGQPGGTSQPDHATAEPASHDGADGTLPNASNNAGVLEERISPASASKAEAGAAAPHPRENGKAGDGVAGATSPDGVRLEVGGSPTADGSKGVVSSDSAGEQQDKDKAKRRPKCCVVM